MKNLLIILSLLLTSVSWSKDVDYNSVLKHYEAGNYMKAIDIWKPHGRKWKYRSSLD